MKLETEERKKERRKERRHPRPAHSSASFAQIRVLTMFTVCKSSKSSKTVKSTSPRNNVSIVRIAVFHDLYPSGVIVSFSHPENKPVKVVPKPMKRNRTTTRNEQKRKELGSLEVSPSVARLTQMAQHRYTTLQNISQNRLNQWYVVGGVLTEKCDEGGEHIPNCGEHRPQKPRNRQDIH